MNDVVSLPADVSRESVRKSTWFLFNDQPLQDSTQVSIEVRAAQPFQVWQGFGAAVSELGARSLTAIPAAERDRFFLEAFSRKQGLGLDWIRLPVGASDFALDAYSLAYQRFQVMNSEVIANRHVFGRSEKISCGLGYGTS